jgi:hypothetical protein
MNGFLMGQLCLPEGFQDIPDRPCDGTFYLGECTTQENQLTNMDKLDKRIKYQNNPNYVVQKHVLI